MHKYANEIILYLTIRWKDLSIRIRHSDNITCNKQRQFKAELSLYLLFYNLPLFSEIFINIDKYAK